jgi:IS30 family transposase
MPMGIESGRAEIPGRAEDLARYAESLNNRPHKTPGYLKPSKRLAELLTRPT